MSRRDPQRQALDLVHSLLHQARTRGEAVFAIRQSLERQSSGAHDARASAAALAIDLLDEALALTRLAEVAASSCADVARRPFKNMALQLVDRRAIEDWVSSLRGQPGYKMVDLGSVETRAVLALANIPMVLPTHGDGTD